MSKLFTRKECPKKLKSCKGCRSLRHQPISSGIFVENIGNNLEQIFPSKAERTYKKVVAISKRDSTGGFFTKKKSEFLIA